MGGSIDIMDYTDIAETRCANEKDRVAEEWRMQMSGDGRPWCEIGITN